VKGIRGMEEENRRKGNKRNWLKKGMKIVIKNGGKRKEQRRLRKWI
jgi:hypothetical protein